MKHYRLTMQGLILHTRLCNEDPAATESFKLRLLHCLQLLIKVTNFKIDAAKLKTLAETPGHFAELGPSKVPIVATMAAMTVKPK